MKTRRLSKSQYCKGRKCLKRVWLYNYRKDLMEPPSPIQEAIFTQGHEVGVLAQSLVPAGELIDEDHTDPEGALAHTEAAIKAGKTTLYEGAFLFEDILIRVDIISKNKDGRWELFEVKSTTSVKKDHLYDAAIQKYVLNNLGYDLERTCLVHLNNEYIRKGEVNLKKLFTIEQIDTEIEEAYAEIPAYLKSIRKALKEEQEPTHRIGSVCKNPYQCEFKKYCWLGVAPDSIHFLTRITDAKRFELMDQAIERVKEIPDDFALTELQFVQVKTEKSGNPTIEKKKISKHLSELVFPLWFLDFETVGFAVPNYDGTRSYEQLPFQYSLHVQREPGAELEHYEFLHKENSDPRLALAEAMCQAIGSTGSVIAYHASFEKGRIEDLLAIAPDLQPKLQSIIDRLWDLETPFAKRWYCHPEFHGSSSIKKVLPVLVPGLTYEGMPIGKGDVAQMKYVEMVQMPTGSPDKDTIYKNLLDYCKLDTLAMAKILEALLSKQYE
ncbi:MAG: DUF2779 domain-containing protein [Bdellovibrionia bacterium]